jgi:ribose transport system permease protein
MSGARVRSSVGRSLTMGGRYPVVWATILVLVGSRIFYGGFFSATNLSILVSQQTPNGLVAIGMTVLLITGAFDLSAGAILALAAVIYTNISNSMPLALAGVLTLLIGMSAGLINGFIVTKLRVNAFVATLGTGSAFAGVALLYTGGQAISANKPSFQTLGNGAWLGVPINIVLLVLIAALVGIVLAWTRFGRSVYAVGGNAEASRLSGIRVDAVRITAFMFVGLCSAFGGMVLASSLGVVQSSVGANAALDSIAIVIVGGTSLLGGEGAMWRTACGFLILASIENVLDALAVAAAWQNIITGGIIVSAVALELAGSKWRNFRERYLTTVRSDGRGGPPESTGRDNPAATAVTEVDDVHSIHSRGRDSG